jgi:hypothetical protein
MQLLNTMEVTPLTLLKPPKKRRPSKAKRRVLVIEGLRSAAIQLTSLMPEKARSVVRVTRAHSYRHAVKLLRPRFDTAYAKSLIKERLADLLPKGVTAVVTKANGKPQHVALLKGKTHKKEVPKSKLSEQINMIIESIEKMCRKVPFDAVLLDATIPLSDLPHSRSVWGHGLACFTLAKALGIKDVAIRANHEEIPTSPHSIPGRDDERLAIVFTDQDLLKDKELPLAAKKLGFVARTLAPTIFGH